MMSLCGSLFEVCQTLGQRRECGLLSDQRLLLLHEQPLVAYNCRLRDVSEGCGATPGAM